MCGLSEDNLYFFQRSPAGAIRWTAECWNLNIHYSNVEQVMLPSWISSDNESKKKKCIGYSETVRTTIFLKNVNLFILIRS